MKKSHRTAIACLAAVLALAAAPMAMAYQTDYAQNVAIDSDPSPRDVVTGSSINQFGPNQTNSQVDTYLYQDEQINLDKDSGIVRVLRTNQKANVNDFVTAVVPLQYANPRELRGLARTICRKEGGDADVLQDKVKKKNYLVVVCPKFQLPYVMETLKAIDHEWIAEINDGSWYTYYQGQNRDVRNMMNVLQVYRSPDGQWDFDDSNNAVLFYDQPNVEPLFRWGSSEIDIPPNQIALDVKLYEVDTQNSLELGFDFQSWKNGPGRSLFEYIVWDFNGDDPMNLFPGNVIGNVADWGNYHAYNFTISTAYVDFLQTKGKARLLTESTISAKSGTVAELAAVDQIATFQTAYTTPPANRNLVDPLRLSQIYEYYESQGRVRVPIENFENMAVAAVINEIRWFCQNVLGIFSNATLQQIENELLDQGADGSIDVDEMYSITVPMSITLQVFHDRTLTYLKQECKTGVLLSILPVVGIESAELAIALDVSDVNGYTDVGAPIIEHRYFSSAVEVKNGQPFVLAGIKRSADVSMASGIPYLRDIPWLGYAFGKETTKKVEKDLVVFLVPRFQLCQTSDTQPAEEVKTAIALAKGEAVLEVPETSFGFDQWILDPAK